jgi:hypothetical protein
MSSGINKSKKKYEEYRKQLYNKLSSFSFQP